MSRFPGKPLTTADRRRGWTLIEVGVAGMVSLLLLVVVLEVFRYARGVTTKAGSTYVLGQDAATTLRQLRGDLSQTSFTSLKSWKLPDGQRALTLARAAHFDVNGQGAPQWSHWVTYATEPGPEPGVALLVRREISAQFPAGLPLALTDPTPPAGGSRKVLAQIVAPGWKLAWKSPPELLSDSNAAGGFWARYVRQSQGEETLAEVHPMEQSDAKEDPLLSDNSEVWKGWSAGTTRLLEIRLQLLYKSGDRLTSCSLPIRVYVRNF